MKMWSTNVLILLLFCYACLSTGNGKVYFESKNFYNVLRWDPVEPAFPGQKVLYTVEYLSDAQDQNFEIKEECQNIPDLFCDLTNETTSLHDVYYVAKVSVNGSTLGLTTRFRPLAETNFGPPILSTHTTASTLHVKAALPTGPKGEPISDIMAKSKNGISKTVPLYTLQITSPKWAALTIESESEQFIINMKNNQTEYCGVVFYKPSTDWGRLVSQNASFCVTLKNDSRMLWQTLFMSAAVLGVVIIASIACACTYVKGGKSKDIPQALTISSGTHKVALFSDKNLIISKVSESSQTEQITYAEIKAMAKVSSSGSDVYSPQDIPCQAWKNSSGSSMSSGAQTTNSHVGGTSAQSSEIYGAVAIHIPADEEKDFQQVTTEHRKTSQPGDSRESWDMNSHEATPVAEVDSYGSHLATPLLLKTGRDNKGGLTLPLLSFQSVSGDTTSALTPDRTPRLSDILIYSADKPSLMSLLRLDSSDSGCDNSSVESPTHQYCNSHYHQSQPYFPQGWQDTQSNNAVLESGYSKQQNWMSAMRGGHP